MSYMSFNEVCKKSKVRRGVLEINPADRRGLIVDYIFCCFLVGFMIILINSNLYNISSVHINNSISIVKQLLNHYLPV